MSPRYFGLITMLLGAAGTAIVGWLFAQDGSGVTLEPPCSVCSTEAPSSARAFEIYLAQSRWLAMFAFEVTVAVIALAYAGWGLFASARTDRAWRRPEWMAILLVGGLALWWLGKNILAMSELERPEGFLSALLLSLGGKCPSVADHVERARLVGELSGVVLAIAMSCTVAIFGSPTAERLAGASQRLQRLLYLSSLLFVAGLMVSRANFMLVLVRWEQLTLPWPERIETLVQSGVVQSGVAYSAILAFFYLPARALLERVVGSLVPEDARATSAARKAWLEERGLATGWSDELRQILALLAPIVSAPVLDALLKV